MLFGGVDLFKFLSKAANAVANLKIGFVSAIVLCAGNSTRFGKENKQMAMVNGKEVAARTLAAFEDCDIIKETVLVVGKDDIELYKQLVLQNGFKKVKNIVTGGETRQISASRGFRHISEKAKYVAIHDGARCLVTPSIIEKVVREASVYGVASAACRISDTVKAVDENGFVKKTLDRSGLMAVQTPQVLERKLYASCSYSAKKKEIEATDDCALAEAFGFKVKLVDTGRDNIKITVADDISLAEHILRRRGDN